MPWASQSFGKDATKSRGEGAKGGQRFRPPGAAEMPARAARPALRPPHRPARKSQYPIDLETFSKLKTTAIEPRISRQAKMRATLAADRAVSPASAAPVAPALVAAAAPPRVVSSYPGIPATGWFPFDCAEAAGPNHIVCAVNSSVSVFSRAGAVLAGQTLDAWFASVVQNATIFDPKLIFDAAGGRFVLLAVATNDHNDSWFLLSISHTSDATGPWWNYALDATVDGATKTNNWADYPSLGQDADCLYLTANMFQVGGGFQHAKLRILPKAGVYAGGTPTFHDVTGLQNSDGSPVFTLQPCNTLDASPTEYLVNSLFPTGATPNPSEVTLWSVSNGATDPLLASQKIQTVPYGLPPHAEQTGSAPPLDSGDTRALHAVSASGSVWLAFNTQHNWDGGANVAAIHWLQVDPASGSLLQEGIFGSAGLHYYYPALMPDSTGNLFLVFSRSGVSEAASVYCTGRAKGDPAGSLAASVLLQAGVGPYVQMDTQGRNRWGDYAGATADPADGAAVWLNSGFSAGANQWATRVAQVKL